METNHKIQDYVTTLCDQIRWKKAKEKVSQEIYDHIEDTKNGYIMQGLSEDDAIESAIIETGDPIDLGTQFDRLHRPKPQWRMFGLVFILTLIGFAIDMFLFGDSPTAINYTDRVLWVAAGTVVMFVFYFADFTMLAKSPATWTFFTPVLFVLVFSAMFGRPANNMYDDTASLLLLIYPLVFVSMLFNLRDKGAFGFIPCFTSLLVVGSMVSMLSVAHALAIILVCLCMLPASVYKGWFFKSKRGGYIVSTSACFVGIAVFLVPVLGISFRSARLNAIFNPWDSALSEGFFTITIREMISSAVWLGQGTPSYSFAWLVDETVFVFFARELLLAHVIFRFGWLPFLVVIGVIVAFIGISVKKCFAQKSALGFMVSLVVIAVFSVQILFYVLTNLGLPFVTSLQLPFVSPSAFGTMVNMALAGLMLSVFRTGDVVSDSRTVTY